MMHGLHSNPPALRSDANCARSRALISYLPACLLLPLQAAQELSSERSARVGAEQHVTALRGELETIAQVGAGGCNGRSRRVPCCCREL